MSDLHHVEHYLRLFKGREDYFAQQGEDHYRPVKRAFDESYLIEHLKGTLTCGLYVLNRESKCNLICVDIDIPKAKVAEVDIRDYSAKYSILGGVLNAILASLSEDFHIPHEALRVEETGGRGCHVWLFFSEPIRGTDAVKFGAALKNNTGLDFEFFPKQGELNESRKYGNLIKLPLGVHRKYNSRSCFVTVGPSGVAPIEGIDKNLDSLASVKPMDSAVFKSLVDSLPTDSSTVSSGNRPGNSANLQRTQYEGDTEYLFEGCTAMRNIRLKAESGTPLEHDEAFYLADVLLSVDGGEALIHSIVERSYGQRYSKDRAQREIDKISPLQIAGCRTLYQNGVCPAYCKESVKKRNEDPLVTGTNPCSVWLKRKTRRASYDVDTFATRIGDPESVRQAYFQLKNYHHSNEAPFFDPFDFNAFEARLDVNCKIIAKALEQKTQFSLLGCMAVRTPKKLGPNKEMDYREMAYISVYDEVPVQTVFNSVAPVIEELMHPSSFGYRWNTDPDRRYEVFEDWREAYPRFRNAVMKGLEATPNGYYVCCDLKGYYDHIDHEILIQLIRGAIADQYILSSVERVIDSYSYQRNGETGVPQGPAYARLLANFYLNDFDQFAANLGVGYFRYVDDFVLVFRAEEDATNAIKEINDRLHNMKLQLSDDEAKAPVVLRTTNISRARKTLDKIHYGILEATRHVESFAPREIDDFALAVERDSVSPLNVDELLNMNEKLPSLLYVVAKETLTPTSLTSRVIDILEFLVERKLFCAKRLGRLFHELVLVEPNEERLVRIFENLESSHKVSFLLSVFSLWESDPEKESLLKKMAEIGLNTDDDYVFGFSLAVSRRFESSPAQSVDPLSIAQKLSQHSWNFSLIKWVSTLDYVEQAPEVRSAIRAIITKNSPELIRMYLALSIRRPPTDYVDSIYLKSLLHDSDGVMYAASCSIFAALTGGGDLFDAVAGFIANRFIFKSILIRHIVEQIFERRSQAGRAEVENLSQLYTHIADPQLKGSALAALSNIRDYRLAYDEDFAKTHEFDDQYNECYLFRSARNDVPYDYIELIPADRLESHMATDPDRFRKIVEQFCEFRILPNATVSYDTNRSEIRLEYKLSNEWRSIDLVDQSSRTSEILAACRLVCDVYKKAVYYQRSVGRVPRISRENLVVNKLNGEAAFCTVGRSLASRHVIGGRSFGNEQGDVTRMVSWLLQTLVFQSDEKFESFRKSKPHSGMEAMLLFLIERTRSGETRNLVSAARFAYLVERMQVQFEGKGRSGSMALFYLSERLKGGLYRHNPETVTWQGICGATEEHLNSHIDDVVGVNELRRVHYPPVNGTTRSERTRLHSVSRYLLDLSDVGRNFRPIEDADRPYVSLVELVLVYGALCMEVVSMARSVRSSQSFAELLNKRTLSTESIEVVAGMTTATFEPEKVASLLMIDESENARDILMSRSLELLCIQILLSLGFEAGDGQVIVIKNGTMRQSEFEALCHDCLVRIPEMERIVAQEVIHVVTALRSNEEIAPLGDILKMRESIRIVIHDFAKIRSRLGFRRASGRADGRYFPSYVVFRRRMGRKLHVANKTLPGCPLTSSFPFKTSGYASSIDLHQGRPVNLMIPAEGIGAIVSKLKAGRFFGRRLSFLYSKGIMIVVDAVLMILFISGGVLISNSQDSSSESVIIKEGLVILHRFLQGLALGALGKILLWDVGEWIPMFRRPALYLKGLMSRSDEAGSDE